VICKSCGAENAAEQRFCGMCGAALQEIDSESEPEPQQPHSAASQNFDFSHYPTRPVETHDHSVGLYRRSNENEPVAGEELPTLFAEYKPVSYRFRAVMGLIIAVLVAGLGYLAWRGTQANIGAARPLPAVPAATQPDQQPSPAPQGATNAGTNVPKSEPSAAPPPTGEPASKQPQKTAPATSAASNPPAVTSTKAAEERSANGTAPATSTASKPQGSGAEELSQAEGLLKGGPGKVRDSAQAEKLLWQSVGKQNGSATLMLSDLYLRGDGVPKNCYQARLLLDIAARKGVAGAGERLRNLQAFGCQ